MVQTPTTTSAAPSWIRDLGRFGNFLLAVGASLLAGRWSLREAFFHASQVASRCFLPVQVTIFPFGAVIGLQGMRILDLFSAHRLLSSLMALFVIRELAPVLAAVLVAAQGGSTFAAELGTMRTQEEIDATEVMAVDPIGWHVVPRVLAMFAVVPLLTTIASALGIAGGYVVAVHIYGQSAGVFYAHLAESIGLYDLICAALKGAFYGLLLGLIATYKGYKVTGGAEGVGRAVNDTVVTSVVGILVLNYLLSSLFFGGSGI